MLGVDAAARLIGDGTASAGMIAKLRACEHALAGGADDVVIVDGRDRSALEGASVGDRPERATRLVAATHAT
jgi:acetylglutamate kinase